MGWSKSDKGAKLALAIAHKTAKATGTDWREHAGDAWLRVHDADEKFRAGHGASRTTYAYTHALQSVKRDHHRGHARDHMARVSPACASAPESIDHERRELGLKVAKMLLDGDTLQDAAESLGISVDAARSAALYVADSMG